MLYLTGGQPRYPEQGCSLQVYNLFTHNICRCMCGYDISWPVIKATMII